jgi:F-type H+-transporting ATPase subunit delta
MKTNRTVKRAARRLFRLSLVDGALAERRVRRIAERLSQSKRRGALTVLADFRRLVRLDRNRHTALIQSASSLAPDLRRGIRAGLVRVYGPGLTTTFERNEGLIGGLRITIGSDVYDGSVRARLTALAASL